MQIELSLVSLSFFKKETSKQIIGFWNEQKCL